MSIAIVDYGSGNLHSAAKAFERALREQGQTRPVHVTAEPELVAAADHIVLPGVGAFADCRAGLFALPGMVAALEEAVLRRGRPFLGICVGMQLMASLGLEHGRHRGLDWIAGEIRRLTPEDAGLKVPHMGWNEIALRRPHPVFAGIGAGAHAYFVHSYRFVPADERAVVAEAYHGGALTAALGRDNLVGTQFHPEKSQATGLRLIANFMAWRP